MRVNRDVSADELADATGIPKGTIIAWERNPGRLNPNKPDHREAVNLMAKALDASQEQIWGSVVRERRADYGDLTGDLASFLVTIGFDADIPGHIRDQARVLLSGLVGT